MGSADLGIQSFVAGYLTSEPLVGIGWNGRPMKRLVSEWVWAPDRLALRLKLLPNLRYHDDTAIDAALAAQVLQVVVKNPRSQQAAVSYNSITGVQAEGRDTLVITLSRPEAFLLSDLANSTLTHQTKPDVGVGPYRLLERTPKARLAAFDKYYRGRPQIDVIEVQDYKEQRGAWAALMRGEIDAVHEINPTAIDFVEDQTTVRTFPVIRPYFFFLAFNMRHPTLGKTVVRQALSEAVDREEILNQGLSGKGIVADGPVWPFHWAYSTAQKAYTRNTDAATLRLDAAGLRVRPDSGPKRMASRFRFKCTTVANDPRFERIALLLQKQLYDIGVDMEIEALPVPELLKRIGTGQFEAVLLERTSGRSLAWAYLTFHSKQTPLGYTAADTVLDRLRVATEDNEIRTAAGDLQRILHDDPPAIFLVWPKVARAVSTNFVVPEEPGTEVRDVMSSIWLWRPRGSEK